MTKTLDGIVLSDFVEILLGRADSVHCPEYIADKIAALDPEEIYTHIEKPSEENKSRFVEVWRIGAWRMSHAKFVRTKEYHTLERQVYVLSSELRAVIVKKLCNMTGLDEEQALRVAMPIVKTRNVTICQQMFKINLNELLAADAALQAFKQKENIR